jgi:TRAP-type C4-dicarboxylate transport system permease small subunit
MVNKVNVITKKIADGAMALAILLLALSAAFMIMQVLLRYLFSFSFPWTEELSRYMMVYVTFFASAILLREDQNPRVDIVYMRLPKRVKFVFNTVFYILILVLMVVLFQQGLKAVTSSAGELTPSLRISWAIPYMAIPIGSIAMACQLPFLAIQNYRENWLEGGLDND